MQQYPLYFLCIPVRTKFIILYNLYIGTMKYLFNLFCYSFVSTKFVHNSAILPCTCSGTCKKLIDFITSTISIINILLVHHFSWHCTGLYYWWCHSGGARRVIAGRWVTGGGWGAAGGGWGPGHLRGRGTHSPHLPPLTCLTGGQHICLLPCQ